MNRAPDAAPMTPSDLLTFLFRRGGQEYAVQLVSPQSKPSKAKPSKKPPAAPTIQEQPLYRLILRGEEVQATGPSGQTRQLSRQAFLEVFGAYHFAGAEPTGVLSDLGPLFGAG
ncbi:hypothetical protein [Deinococcus detaillensis]|nr:hypothetical protein [Deinococcus detaillensis]